MLWPQGLGAAEPEPATAAPVVADVVAYGWAAGLAGATCAAIGFAADLEHVGWAPAAALLVMRPNPPVQPMRSADRLADVVLGAVAAILLVLAGPPARVYATVIALVGVAASAGFVLLPGARWRRGRSSLTRHR